MIALFERGKLMRAAQEDIAGLKQQVAALMTQVAAVTTQLAAEAERAALAEAEARAIRERLDALETAATLQASAISAQATGLELLRKLSEKNEEAVKQGRGALARLEKQVEVDLVELRRFDATVAATMMRHRGESSPGGGWQDKPEA